MAVIKAEETKLVGAPPEKVYAILADPQHHRKILPDAFVSFAAEADGTFTLEVRTGFARRSMRIRMEETEANKLLRETDLATGAVTEFRLEVHEEGTLVTIATNYSKDGISGLIESWLGPPVLRRLFDEELTKLCRYALIANIQVP